MRKYLPTIRLLMSIGVTATTGATALAGDFSNRPEVTQFIDKLVREDKFDRTQLVTWLDAAEKKQAILDAIAKPAEKEKTWGEYRQIFLTDERISLGVQFWKDNADTLQRVSTRYGVDPEIIIAIIGVETRYGRNTGNYRVIDSLSTLAFDYPSRATFFREQLREYFLLTREQHHDPLELKGSYAGAMGYGQFMPSSYRRYAVDFNDDNFADIWSNPGDAAASVANYFKEHGWEKGRLVATRCHINNHYDDKVFDTDMKPAFSAEELEKKGFLLVDSGKADDIFAMYKLEGSYGAEFWAGARNFYVITRYNHSPMYALAVYQLSQAIKERYQGTSSSFDWGG